MKPRKTLVLFDIDGTLIRRVAEASDITKSRYFKPTAAEVFGVTQEFDWRRYDGLGDKKAMWEIVRERKSITYDEYEAAFPLVIETLHKFLLQALDSGLAFGAIPQATSLVERLARQPHISMGVLTGNVERNARLKLKLTGYDGFFPFGLFAEEAHDRASLARLAFAKAKGHFGHAFLPSDVVIIGDTVHDVRCGKAIGARTIAVTTGVSATRDHLAAENPDLLVDHLLQREVDAFLHLKATNV